MNRHRVGVRRWIALAVVLIWVAAGGCSSDDGAKDAATASDSKAVADSVAADGPAADGSADALGPVSCTLGSVYPGAVAIDPDNPDYEGDGKTKAEVVAMFAQAKVEDSRAYRAYKAAFLYPELTECAYCACGCDLTSNHKSAIDCFKDLHGFT